VLLFDANNDKKQAKWQLSDFQIEHFQLFPKSVIFFPEDGFVRPHRRVIIHANPVDLPAL
jgi:hypothetical protein